MTKTTPGDGIKVVAQNRRAAHDYFLEAHVEAGLVLRGSEIKSIRAGRANLKEAYVRVEAGEATLINAHIATYDPAARDNHDPLRPRRLLLHKKQIRQLYEQIKQKGYTVIPTRLYLSKGRAKVEIALAKGKKNYDKREAIAKRDAARDIARELGRRS